VTLPLLLALKRCTAAEREGAAALLKTAGRRAASLTSQGVNDPEQVLSEEDLAPVLELVHRYRGVEDTDRRAREHTQRAASAVAPFPDGEAKRALLEAAEFAVTREH
jgi:geranylgeranyl pyrophosphate synthase